MPASPSGVKVSVDDFELVDRLLPQLDGDSVFSRLNFRVFPLKKATATKLQSTLQHLTLSRRGFQETSLSLKYQAKLSLGGQSLRVVPALLFEQDHASSRIGETFWEFLPRTDVRQPAWVTELMRAYWNGPA